MAKSVRQARPPRVRLAGTVLLLAKLQNGRHVRGKLHQLSITGGVMHLEKPLDEGVKVEVLFHVGNCTVRSKARMMFPMWATQGLLQPFEFDNLAEAERQQLESDLRRLLQGANPAPVIEEQPSETISPSDPA